MIDITKLKKDTTLILETANSIYEIIVEEPESRQVIINSSMRFPEPTRVTLGNLEYQQPISIQYENNGIRHKVMTSPIVSGTLSSADNSWHYDIWERKAI